MVVGVGRLTPYYTITSHYIHKPPYPSKSIHTKQPRRTPHAGTSRKNHGGTLPYPYSRQRVNRFTVPQTPTTLRHFRPQHLNHTAAIRQPAMQESEILRFGRRTMSTKKTLFVVELWLCGFKRPPPPPNKINVGIKWKCKKREAEPGIKHMYLQSLQS